MKDEKDDLDAHGTRYHHFIEVMGEDHKQIVLSYDDLFAILNISWEELEKMNLPELSQENKRNKNKTSYTYSTGEAKGTTIGEILASQGVLIKLDDEE